MAKTRRQLYIWQKLWTLGLVFLLFFAVPTGFFVKELLRTLDRSRAEATGVDEARAATEVARALAIHRLYAAATLAGASGLANEREQARAAVDAAMKSLEAGLAPALRAGDRFRSLQQGWSALADAVGKGLLEPRDSNARHGELAAAALGLCETVLEQRELAYDADPRISHAVSIAFVQSPTLLQSMAEAESAAVLLLAARNATPEERRALAGAFDRVKEQAAPLEARVRKAMDSDPAWKERIGAVQGDAQAQLADFVRTGRVDVVFSAALDRPVEAHLRAQRLALAGPQALATAATREGEAILEGRARTERLRLAAIGALIAVAVAVALGFGIWTGRSIARPLGHAVKVADGIAAGRLDHFIDPRRARNAEAGRLMGAFAAMQAALSALVADIQAASHEIHAAAGRVADGNAELSARTEEQAASLEESSATLEELTAAVRRNAESAAQAAQAVEAASASAGRGDAAVAGVVASMQTINEAARRIGDIIAVIDGIAFQTNILALNAAVEAARAGEQGRGFAVVAAEVRSLAQRSAVAAQEIKALARASAEAAAQGSGRVDEAGAAMRGIGESVERVTALFGEMATASSEQRHAIEQVNRAVGEMDRATQQNAGLVGAAAASSEALQGQARALAELVARFHIARAGDGEGPPAVAAPPARQIPLLQGAE